MCILYLNEEKVMAFKAGNMANMLNEEVIPRLIKELPDRLNPKMYRAILDGLCRDSWINCAILGREGEVILPLTNDQDSQREALDVQPVIVEVSALDQAVGRVVIRARDAGREAATGAGRLIAQSVQHRLERLYHKELVARLTAIREARRRLGYIVKETCEAIDQTVRRDDYWRCMAQFLDRVNDVLSFSLSLVLIQKAPPGGGFKVRVTSSNADVLRNRYYTPDQLKFVGEVLRRLEPVSSRFDLGAEVDDALLGDVFNLLSPAEVFLIPTRLTGGRLAIVVFSGDDKRGRNADWADWESQEHMDLLTSAIAQVSLAFTAQQWRQEARLDRARYIHVATHQLKEPLAGINYYCQALTNESIPFEKRVNYPKYIQAMATTWAGFVQNLAWASQRSEDIFRDDRSIEFKEENINKILIDVAIALQPFAELQKESRIHVEEGRIIRAEVSDNHFRQAVLNILHNAVKYCDRHTDIQVQARLERDQVIVTFTDQGIRVPPGLEEKIFEREFRAPEAREVAPEGTGLGLFIVKEVMKLHNGSASVECRELPGGRFRTTFTLKLPRRQTR